LISFSFVYLKTPHRLKMTTFRRRLDAIGAVGPQGFNQPFPAVGPTGPSGATTFTASVPTGALVVAYDGQKSATFVLTTSTPATFRVRVVGQTSGYESSAYALQPDGSIVVGSSTSEWRVTATTTDIVSSVVRFSPSPTTFRLTGTTSTGAGAFQAFGGSHPTSPVTALEFSTTDATPVLGSVVLLV
jgi:hypothetical protein